MSTNTISDDSINSNIFTGNSNSINDDSTNSFIGGGLANSLKGNNITICGGSSNNAISNYSAISGGYNNKASGRFSSIIGGSNNTASGKLSSTLGGSYNTASGDYSIAGGYYGVANNANSASLSYSTTVDGEQVTCETDTDGQFKICADVLDLSQVEKIIWNDNVQVTPTVANNTPTVNNNTLTGTSYPTTFGEFLSSKWYLNPILYICIILFIITLIIIFTK